MLWLVIQHIRPGAWIFSTSQSRLGIASFHQYEHLAELKNVLEAHSELKVALGGDYLITPDIVVSRLAVDDAAVSSFLCKIFIGQFFEERQILTHFSYRA